MLRQTDTATIVVAFWGAGAIDKLGLRKNWESLRIVCNLESGACNPREIEALMALGKGVEVRSDLRLHGKVYLTSKQVVLGSSNASSNGLVVEGPVLSGWAEANITSTEVELLSQVRAWCDVRFRTAGEITPAKLGLAHVAWNARRPLLSKACQLISSPPSGDSPITPPSIVLSWCNGTAPPQRTPSAFTSAHWMQIKA